MLTLGTLAPSTAQHGSTVLGLFPWIGPESLGGIQLSGRLAWEDIVASAPQNATTLLCYAPSIHLQEGDRLPQTYIMRSRFAAVRLTLRRLWKADMVFIWHISLLRLLPFLRIRSAHVILFLHGIEVWRRHDLLTRLLLPRVNLFVSNSNYTWQCFLTYYPSLAGKPHQTVYLGVDAPADIPSAEPADPPAVLIISRLARGEDYKGHRELIAAWPLVLQHIPNAALWIAGDGDLRPALEHLVATRGLTQHIRFFGRISEEQKQDLLMRCRCFAMPSRGEGFGLVYLEAMRLGRPCLVSDCDAGREVVNPPEAGLAVNPDDTQALAAALLRLLTPGNEWSQWSVQARRRYESQFTARHFQERLVGALAR